MLSMLLSAAILELTTKPSGASTALTGTRDLMQGVSSRIARAKAADEAFCYGAADFAMTLFQKTMDRPHNTLISPLSVMLALSLAANGADGETLAQMEIVLGSLSVYDLNVYLFHYRKTLAGSAKSKFCIANSLWLRNTPGLEVSADFLQTNANYYGMQAYRSDFDAKTVVDINAWVRAHTGGMLDRVLDWIDPQARLYLINAVAFAAEWQRVYTLREVAPGTFTDISGARQTVAFMHGTESVYLEDDQAAGFMKPYAGGAYSFLALLPHKRVKLRDYAASLDGERWLSLLQNAQRTPVATSLPKFQHEGTVAMRRALEDMDMTAPFAPEQADFHRMASGAPGNLYIEEILHKIYIQVDERGTRAGARTPPRMAGGAGVTARVELNRPFVYAIVDNATQLPLFMGSVTTLQGLG